MKYRRQSKKKDKLREESPTCSIQTFISILKKKPYERQTQIKVMIDFLSKNFDYFIKIRHIDHDKLIRIATALNYEYFTRGEKIINCGDQGDKFYIVIQGKVSVCKPIPYSTKISFRDYVEYVHQIKHIEKNSSKFRRIIGQNAHIDHYALDKIDYNYTQINQSKKTQTYILEKEKKLSEFGNGFPFGELALIKREPRNASIYAIENTVLVSLDKLDYNRIIRDIEEKRLAKKASEFVIKFPLFKHWGVGQLFRMFNYFEKSFLFGGDYLYKQNDASDYIYFVNSGVFEMNSVFSFAWYEQFIDYIHDSSFSIADRMHNKAQFSNEENFKAFLKEAKDEIVSPCLIKPKQKKPILSLEEKEMNILDIKLEEDNLKKSKNSFKALIKYIKIPECLGYEDGLELKPRYTTVKCISAQADIDKIQLVEFIKLLPCDKVNQEVFQRNVFEKKQVLIHQLQNNAILQLVNIDSRLKDKYRKAVEKEHMVILKAKHYSNDKKVLCSESRHLNSNSNRGDSNTKAKLPKYSNSTLDQYIKNNPLLRTHQASVNEEDNELNKVAHLFKEKSYLNRNDKYQMMTKGTGNLKKKKKNKSMIDRSAMSNSELANDIQQSFFNEMRQRKGKESFSKIRKITHTKLDELSNRNIESNTTQLMTKANSSLSIYLNNNNTSLYGNYKNNIKNHNNNIKTIILKKTNFKSFLHLMMLPEINKTSALNTKDKH